MWWRNIYGYGLYLSSVFWKFPLQDGLIGKTVLSVWCEHVLHLPHLFYGLKKSVITQHLLTTWRLFACMLLRCNNRLMSVMCIFNLDVHYLHCTPPGTAIYTAVEMLINFLIQSVSNWLLISKKVLYYLYCLERKLGEGRKTFLNCRVERKLKFKSLWYLHYTKHSLHHKMQWNSTFRLNTIVFSSHYSSCRNWMCFTEYICVWL